MVSRSRSSRCSRRCKLAQGSSSTRPHSSKACRGHNSSSRRSSNTLDLVGIRSLRKLPPLVISRHHLDSSNSNSNPSLSLNINLKPAFNVCHNRLAEAWAALEEGVAVDPRHFTVVDRPHRTLRCSS
jgi:hypothetical protein